VLDHHYADWQDPNRLCERAIIVDGARESDVIPLLETFEQDHPQLRLSCLPSLQGEAFTLELGLRGSPADVDQAMPTLCSAIEALGFSWRAVRLSHAKE